MSSGQMIRLMVAVPSSSISTDMPRNPAASQGLVPLCINQVAAWVSEHMRRHTAFEERLANPEPSIRIAEERLRVPTLQHQ